MKTILLLLFITTVLFSPGLIGQEKRDYIWIFADDDHPNDNMGEGVIMDFNTLPVVPEFLDKEMQINCNRMHPYAVARKVSCFFIPTVAISPTIHPRNDGKW